MARESTQLKLERVRAPRVHITYDIETGGALEKREVPFVIGVMGDYSGSANRESFPNRAFRNIDFDNFNHVMAELGPRVSFRISSSIAGGEMDVDLAFQSIEDFAPESLIARLPILASLKQSQEP